MNNPNKITIRSNDGFCEVLQNGKVLKGLTKIEILPITTKNQDNIQARLTFTDVELELSDVAANDEYLVPLVPLVPPVILTSSGNTFDFRIPDQCAIDIEVIAHALSNQCRFGGHCREFYSVAQHSVLVSQLVPVEHALKALLHDAAEAYLVDVPSPIKPLIPGYGALERRVHEAVFAAFGLTPELPPEVKHCDLVALATEKRDLMPEDGPWALLEGIATDPYEIAPLPPQAAKTLFLDRFYALTKQAAA